jgi:hypothetical protein
MSVPRTTVATEKIHNIFIIFDEISKSVPSSIRPERWGASLSSTAALGYRRRIFAVIDRRLASRTGRSTFARLVPEIDSVERIERVGWSPCADGHRNSVLRRVFGPISPTSRSRILHVGREVGLTGGAEKQVGASRVPSTKPVSGTRLTDFAPRVQVRRHRDRNATERTSRDGTRRTSALPHTALPTGNRDSRSPPSGRVDSEPPRGVVPVVHIE